MSTIHERIVGFPKQIREVSQDMKAVLRWAATTDRKLVADLEAFNKFLDVTVDRVERATASLLAKPLLARHLQTSRIGASYPERPDNPRIELNHDGIPSFETGF